MDPRDLIIAERKDFRGQKTADRLVLLDLIVAGEIDAVTLQIEFVRLHAEIALGEHLFGDLLQRRDVAVDGVGERRRIGGLKGNVGIGAVQETLQLSVELVLVVGVVEHEGIPGEIPETGIDDVERGLLLGDHQDGFPFINKLRDQAGDGLGFSGSGRALYHQLVCRLHGMEDRFLRTVERVDVDQRTLADAFADAAGIHVGPGVVRIEVGLADVGYQVAHQTVDQPLVENFVKVALDGVRVSGELPDDDVGDELERPAGILGEGFAGVIDKLAQRRVRRSFHADVALFIEGEKPVEKLRLEDFLVQDAVGERIENGAELVMREDQRCIEDDVARGVRRDGNGGRVAFDDDREEAERSADAELPVHQTPLDKGISDVEVVLTAVAQIAEGLPDQGDEVAVAVARGIAAGKVLVGCLGDDQRGPAAKDDVQRIVAMIRIKKIDRALGGELGQIEHPVVAVDVDQLFGEFAQGRERFLADGGLVLCAVQDRQKAVCVAFDERRSDAGNALKVGCLCRRQPEHFVNGFV